MFADAASAEPAEIAGDKVKVGVLTDLSDAYEAAVSISVKRARMAAPAISGAMDLRHRRDRQRHRPHRGARRLPGQVKIPD